MTRTCSVSIDVDPISCYYRIHALGVPPPALRTRVLCAALPRFARVLAEKRISATFFIVAQDVDVKALGSDAIAMRVVLRDLLEDGHEIASHSYSHPYELAKLGVSEVYGEIGQADELLSDLVGHEIRGFRAPGYDLSPTILRALVDHGYRYDSSVFPAPGYYAAKALVMGALKLVGRPSGAVMTNPRALLAPIDPYEPDIDKPYQHGASGLLELPIAVTRRSRTPVIGTNLLLAPKMIRRHWLRSMANRDFFNLELHGIDLCDAKQDGMPKALVARQPDLRVALDRKVEALRQVLDEVRQHGFGFDTLANFASDR